MTKGRSLIAVAALLAVCGCDAWLTSPSLYNRLRVTATQPTGEPLPGVALVLYTSARPMGYASTDTTGEFTFTRVPQGNYGVQAVTPPGFHPVNDSINGAGVAFVDGLTLAGDTLAVVRFTFAKNIDMPIATVSRRRAAHPRAPH